MEMVITTLLISTPYSECLIVLPVNHYKWYQVCVFCNSILIFVISTIRN
jgi:hypothetical protein